MLPLFQNKRTMLFRINISCVQTAENCPLTVNWTMFENSNVPFIFQAFLSETKMHYKAELESVDFKSSAQEARVNINSWVEKQTQSRSYTSVWPWCSRSFGFNVNDHPKDPVILSSRFILQVHN